MTPLFHTHIKSISKLFQPYLQIYPQSNHFSLPCLVLSNLSYQYFLPGLLPQPPKCPCFYPGPSMIYSLHSNQDSLKVRICHSSSQSPPVPMACRLTPSKRQGPYNSFRFHVIQLPVPFLNFFLLLAYTATATQTSTEVLKHTKHFPARGLCIGSSLCPETFSRNLHHGLFPHFLRSLFKCHLQEDVS